MNLRLRRRDRSAYVREVYAARLYRPVDVPSPGIRVGENVDREPLVRELAYQPPRPPRRLALRGYQYAVLLLPEPVLVEPLPERVLLHDDHVLCLQSTNSMSLSTSLGIAQPLLPCLLQSISISLVSERVYHLHVPCEHSLPVRVQVEVLPLHVQRDLEILYERVRFSLLAEYVLVHVLSQRVLELVEKAPYRCVKVLA